MPAIFATFLIAALGGIVFFLLHLPMPWMLGPLAFLIIRQAVSKRPVIWPIELRNTGLMLMGYIMGSSLTINALRQIVNQLPAMLCATIVTIGSALLLGYLMYRRSGISTATILLGSVPGGLSQMTVLSEEIPESDLSVVTFMQTVRLLAVVFIVPFLALHGQWAQGSSQAVSQTVHDANLFWLDSPYNWMIFTVFVVLGAKLAHRWHTPTPFLLGSVLASAALVLIGLKAPKPPSILVTLAQISIGSYMGVSVDVDSIRKWKKLLPFTVIGGISVVLISLLIGYFLTQVYPVQLITAFLSTAPGGMAEMGVTATIVNADMSTVTAYQLFRFFFILFVVPLVIKWYLAHVPQRA